LIAVEYLIRYEIDNSNRPNSPIIRFAHAAKQQAQFYQNIKKEYKDYLNILQDKKKIPQQKLEEIVKLAVVKRYPKDNNPLSITVVGAPLHGLLSEIDAYQSFEESAVQKEYSSTNEKERNRAIQYLNAVLAVITSPENIASSSYQEYFAPYAQIIVENEEQLNDIDVLKEIINQYKKLAASFEKKHKSHFDIHHAILQIDLTKSFKKSELAKMTPKKNKIKKPETSSSNFRMFNNDRRSTSEPVINSKKTSLKETKRGVSDLTSRRHKK
jgi:hypothetical protein